MEKLYTSIFILLGCMSSAQSFEEVNQPAFQKFYYSAAAVADANQDGYQDVFFTGAIDSNNDNNVDLTSNTFYKNVGGVFSAAQDFGENSVHLSAVKYIDFDNDGLLDVVTTGLSYNDVVNYRHYRWKNTGSGFTLADNLSGKIYGGFDVFDFNHDGKQDYALNGIQYVDNVGFTYNLDLYLNGKNGFQKNEAWANGTQNGSFKLIDLNNDNELDLIINGFDQDQNPVFIVYKNENGAFVEKSRLPELSQTSMSFADFNGDGFQDFVIAGQNKDYNEYLAVYLNDGAGNFTENEITQEGLSGGGVQVGDFNNDGFYDFVVIGDYDYTSHTKVFLYNPQLQKFEKDENTNLYNVGGSGALAVFDYDNDGNLDILANGFDWSDPNYNPVTKLFRNKTTVANQKPMPPAVVTAIDEGNQINFSWSGATDDKTPANSLIYEFSAGSEPGKSDVAKYIVTTKNWYLNKAELPSKIYWRIKSIDAAKKYSDPSQEKEIAVLGVSDHQYSTVAMFPNPVNNVLNISTKSAIQSFNLYNLAGQQIRAKQISNKQFDLSQLPNGTYIAEVRLENGETVTKKLIKN